MLWIEPCAMMYSGLFGGFIGGCITAITMRKTLNDYMKRCESLWNEDTRILKHRIDELSTKKVDKVVHKPKKHRYNEGYSTRRTFHQRG